MLQDGVVYGDEAWDETAELLIRDETRERGVEESGVVKRGGSGCVQSMVSSRAKPKQEKRSEKPDQ